MKRYPETAGGNLKRMGEKFSAFIRPKKKRTKTKRRRRTLF